MAALMVSTVADHKDVARLERELEILAAAFDRWWFAEADDDGAQDLRVGARLHEEIAVRLVQLEVLRATLATAAPNGASRGPRSTARRLSSAGA
jgi:hypothetical protein